MNKKTLALCVAVASTAATATAQSFSRDVAVDALNLSQSDFKGTARFMSMGGAFTALGGDISAIGLNPAGVGVYRHSEIGVTLDIDMQSTKGKFGGVTAGNDQTKVYCNNFGYVGSTSLDGLFKSLSWGVTYNRAASFDRVVGGYAPSTGTSVSNYIAYFSNGIPAKDMDFNKDTGYNPYYDSGADWLSILGYSSFMINPANNSNDTYLGLYQNGTVADAEMYVRERGYVDNYEFTFGGNIANVVYWGLGVGINDLYYHRTVNYSESLEGARVYDGRSTANGNAGFYLDNYRRITGSGWNISFGLIFKPIQEFRIGAAIHSPTWYSLDQTGYAETQYSYSPDNYPDDPITGNDYTEDDYFSWKLRSPWRFNIGAAAVIGANAIISVDYERVAYNDMTAQTPTFNSLDQYVGIRESAQTNESVREYTQGGNNIRIGVEYRITPSFSARAGFNATMTNIRNAYKSGDGEVYTSGTDLSYSMDKNTNYISVGLGYRYKNFYIDGTYVHKHRSSVLHPYTSYAGVTAPSFDVTDSNNSIVLSAGFKF